MRVNSNTASFIAGFSGARYYQATDGGQFNGEEFCAAVLAYPASTFLNDTSAAAPAEEQWWGNLDVGGTNGWSLGIAPVGDAPTQLAIVGKIGTGAAIITLQYILTNAARAAFAERMMHVSLYRNGTVGYLAINGNIVARADVAAYGASANAPTLGAGVGGARPANRTWIGGAAYLATDAGSVPGALAGSSWEAAAAGMRMGYLNAGGSDWAHRYDINESLLLGGAGTITKTAAGAVLASQPTPPASFPDVGNLGPVVLDPGATPIALTFVGNRALMFMFQFENPEWYQGGGIPFGSGDGGDLSFLGTTVLTTADISPWTVPADTTFIEYQIIGAGGGGGGAAAGAAAAAAGGGGSGGYIWGSKAVVPGSTKAFAVNAGGAGGANTGATGSTGGVTTFDGLTATGGFGGVGGANAATVGVPNLGGAGGAATAPAVGIDYSEPGAPGVTGVSFAATGFSGAGGRSNIAGGAPGLSASAAGTAAAAASGAGGGGALNLNTAAAVGGAGGSGVIIIRRYGP